ncbi:MAG: hypothetical protein ACM31C_22880 [Acidobacteriota bacterium]
MIVTVDRLLARLRHGAPTRAAELASLKRRLRRERAARPAADERATALHVRELKAEITHAIGDVSCCTSCAQGLPAPGGIFAGGHCCSGDTSVIFGDDDVAALAQAGTRAGDLVAPRTEHAGCAFRGQTGCTLAPTERATLCLRYVCNDLRRELHRAGRLDEVERLIGELESAHARFAAQRAARLDREWLAELSAEQTAPSAAPRRP